MYEFGHRVKGQVPGAVGSLHHGFWGETQVIRLPALSAAETSCQLENLDLAEHGGWH